MQMKTNPTSKAEGPEGVPSAALHRASAGSETAGHKTFSRFSVLHTRRLRTGRSC